MKVDLAFETHLIPRKTKGEEGLEKAKRILRALKTPSAGAAGPEFAELVNLSRGSQEVFQGGPRCPEGELGQGWKSVWWLTEGALTTRSTRRFMDAQEADQPVLGRGFKGFRRERCPFSRERTSGEGGERGWGLGGL